MSTMSNFNEIPEVNICLLLFSVLVTLFLMMGVVIDNIRKKPFIKNFLILLTIHCIMQLGEAGIWYFEKNSNRIEMIKICALISYGVGSMFTCTQLRCLFSFANEKEKISMRLPNIVTVICLIELIICVVSIKTGSIYYVDEYGVFKDGKYAQVVNIFDYVTFIIEMVGIAYYHRFFTSKELFVFSIYCILQLITMCMQNIWYPVPMYSVATLSNLLIFVVFHGDLARQLIQTEKELSDSRVAIMVSQIQPHFLYNSLNSIYHLCDKDVKTAKQAISDFSEYLRYILGSAQQMQPIPFECELENVKVYLELEQLRFGEDLNIVYHIEATEFAMPALSIQPIVENAVKHGICGKEDGGTIIIMTKECKEWYEVIVADDGVGFDPDEPLDDGKSHVGLLNVRQRIATMCRGTVTVTSKKGEGTKVIIHIPRE